MEAIQATQAALQHRLTSFSRYATDFFIPYIIASSYFWEIEKDRLVQKDPVETAKAYMDLLFFNMDLFNRGFDGYLKNAGKAADIEMEHLFAALFDAFEMADSKSVKAYIRRQEKLMEMINSGYPDAIEAIEPEYGFHFERGTNPKVAETDRFLLYQIMPTDKDVTVRKNGKPILIIPPYVLGANILAFLPGENRSYAHSFANKGIPTYIRILKDIATTEALQAMTGDDDATDTRIFCEKIQTLHGRPVTLNGYCQGGYSGLCDLLSGELDGLVDAFITCVAPMDGTRSRGLADFLKKLPTRFNDLAYGTKTLPNGNQVADGKLMGWVYKLKSIDTESPVSTFYRDLMMFSRQKSDKLKVGKTAAALNYWLNNERFDLPLKITEMSFASYNTPITADGTLPISLFGRKLNFNYIKEKKIPWLICYGESDDLVEKETALAPLDWVDAEVSAFPKGHVAIATSWSHPESDYALDTRFGEKKYRGPVLFQMDLEAEQDKAAQAKKPSAPRIQRRGK
ncbi:MAG: metal transporter [Desulfotignum sp.]